MRSFYILTFKLLKLIYDLAVLFGTKLANIKRIENEVHPKD